MKLVKAMVLSAAVLVASAPGMAQARGEHGGGHFRGDGWGLGVAAALLLAAPLIVASSYRAQPTYAVPVVVPPNYGYSPVYVQPAYAQPVYAQQIQAPVQQPANVWYYCASSNGYYPYVTQCPEGWQHVSPVPPPAGQ